jgi:ribosomal protein S18 acetylase RimI-like enzyme
MVKEFSKNDLQKCCEVFIQVFNNFPWNDKWTRETAYIYLKELIENKRFLGYTLWDNNSLIGAVFCHLRYNWRGDDINVDLLYISPDYQRKGFGRILMNEIEKFTKENLVSCIVLSTSENTPAFKFYEKMGFAQLGKTVTMFKTKK